MAQVHLLACDGADNLSWSASGNYELNYGKGSGSFKALRIQASSVKCMPFRRKMYLTPFCQRERSAGAFAFDMPSVEGRRVVACAGCK